MIQAWLQRYGRRRRLIAAALAAIAVMSAFLATRPTPAATVLVAARDLSPGPLRPNDLQPTPLNHPPAGAVRTAAAGRVLASPMRRGEPLTDVRLLDSFHLPPGLIATPVRIADADAASLISPGSTISVLAAWTEGQPARSIAEDVTVVTIPPAAKDAGTRGTLVVLATTPSQAAELAAAQASGHLSITISPNLK